MSPEMYSSQNQGRCKNGDRQKSVGPHFYYVTGWSESPFLCLVAEDESVAKLIDDDGLVAVHLIGQNLTRQVVEH